MWMVRQRRLLQLLQECPVVAAVAVQLWVARLARALCNTLQRTERL